VYLHDTPSREKFARVGRDLSHGCVRVSKPWELADFLLAGLPDWSEDKRKTLLDSGTTHHVTVQQTTSIHLIYQTVFTDEKGGIQFREDLYDRDPELIEALHKADSARQRRLTVRH
jgi:murein L,D-transpeptidase YcbB/YkuD